ncbi:MAG: hypothetical protein NTZ21_03745 [Actinobacteria bacterium]|nr:hypothetical protein [Actinomycetota bacterium]
MTRPNRPSRRLGSLALALCALALSACRVDVTVDVDVSENGSGEIAVVVVADADVVAAAPGLAEDLRTDDLVAAGWSTEGAEPTPSGGLSLTIVHPFDTPEQATALLSTLNGPSGPLQAISIQRVATISEITYTVTGTGRLDGGLDAFADPDLLATVGGTPYAEQIAASGAAAVDTVGVVLRVHLPGEVGDTSGQVAAASPDATDGTDADADTDEVGSVVDWPIAMDGSDTVIAATSVKSLERGGAWPVLATVLFIALVAWVAAALVGIVVVARRQRRRHRSMRRLERGFDGGSGRRGRGSGRGLTDHPYERVYQDDPTRPR